MQKISFNTKILRNTGPQVSKKREQVALEKHRQESFKIYVLHKGQ